MDQARTHPPGQYLKLAPHLALNCGSSLILGRWDLQYLPMVVVISVNLTGPPLRVYEDPASLW